MPRFSIRSLLIATTLIAVGLGMICYAEQHHDSPDSESLALFAFFGGGCAIGAGIMAPFNRSLTGAIVTVLLMLLASLLLPAVGAH